MTGPTAPAAWQGTIYLKKRLTLAKNTSLNVKAARARITPRPPRRRAHAATGVPTRPPLPGCGAQEFHSRANLSKGLPTSISAVETDVQSRVEISQKLLNITDTQDMRLRVGLDLLTRAAYAELRENHLTFKVSSSGSWGVLYDL